MKPFALASSLLLAGAAFGQVTKAGAGYDIKVRYAPGQTIRYVISTAVNVPMGPNGKPMSQNQKVSVEQKVVSVNKGIATLAVKAAMSGMGGPNAGKTTTLKVDNRGKVVSGTNSMSFMNGFPARPLRVGESWTSKMPIPQLPGGAATVTYVFRGLKSVGGRSVAQIDYTVTSSGQMAMNGRGTSYIGAADGQLATSTLNGTLRMTPGAGAPSAARPMTMSLTVTMNRA